MKILGLGLDQTILDKDSALAQRAKEYGDLVEKYVVIVPAKSNQEIKLSDKVTVHGIKAGNKIFTLFAIYKLAKKVLKQKKFDVITAQDQYFLALLAYRLAKQFRNGLEVQVHGFEKFSGIRKKIAEFVLPKANVVRVVSQRLKRQLIKDFKVKENNIVVVPIYVDVHNDLPRMERQDGKFIFMTASRLVPVKNIIMQIEAVHKLTKEHDNVELWIFGQGPSKCKIKEQIKSLRLESRVKLKGWVDNLDKYYQQLDAFVLSSDAEGWGMVIVRAASFGLPIIMTDVGCAGEVINDQRSGLVVPVGDTEALHQAMKKIITDDNLRDKLSGGGRQAVQQLPNKEQTRQLYKQSWQQAAKK
jgi:glycosyltransferase involved in cell wall biosynthesis